MDKETEKLIKTALDYVRCGIGANYSRESFEDRMDEIYTPFRKLLESLTKDQPSGLEIVQKALCLKEADLITYKSGNWRIQFPCGDDDVTGTGSEDLLTWAKQTVGE